MPNIAATRHHQMEMADNEVGGVEHDVESRAEPRKNPLTPPVTNIEMKSKREQRRRVELAISRP